MENTLEKTRKPWGLHFWLDTWIGRCWILLGSIQAAIFIASLIIVFPNYIAKGDLLNPVAIYDMLLNASFMAFAQPLSVLFFIGGLSYAIGTYLSLDHQSGYYALMSDLLFFGPYVVYLAIVVSATLTRRRVVFYLLYAALVFILMINISGCVVMPKPTGSM